MDIYGLTLGRYLYWVFAPIRKRQARGLTAETRRPQRIAEGIAPEDPKTNGRFGFELGINVIVGEVRAAGLHFDKAATRRDEVGESGAVGGGGAPRGLQLCAKKKLSRAAGVSALRRH